MSTPNVENAAAVEQSSASTLTGLDRRVAELACHWEAAKNRGEALSPESLCGDCPELLEPLRRQIAILEDMFAILGSASTVDSPNHRRKAEARDAPASWSPPGYELEGQLGRGGMGIVYRARQRGLNRTVALKLISLGAHAEARDLARFHAEAEAVARLQHPSIVQVYEIGEHEGVPFFSLEYCAGGSLDRWLGGMPLPAATAATIVENLARAMNYAHERGIVHRDLKPSNILLQEAVDEPGQSRGMGYATTIRPGRDPRLVGNDEVELSRFLADRWDCKIADFGLAKRLDEPGQTVTGAIVGTPMYMAPEQAEGLTDSMGPPVDIYALGAILYELLTGRPPFVGATMSDTLTLVRNAEPLSPSRLVPVTPRDLETICLKCLNKSPSRRYASAGELANELGRFRAHEPILARPVGMIEWTWRWCRRKPVLASLLASLVVVIVGSMVTITILWQRAETAKANADIEKTAAESERVKTQNANAALEKALLKSDAQLYSSVTVHPKLGKSRAAARIAIW